MGDKKVRRQETGDVAAWVAVGAMAIGAKRHPCGR